MPRILDYILQACRVIHVEAIVNGSNTGKKVEAMNFPLLSMVYS
jgi:hypothetical protein